MIKASGLENPGEKDHDCFFDKARAPATMSRIKDIPKKPKNTGRERIPARMRRTPAAVLSGIAEPTIPRTIDGIPTKRKNGKNPIDHIIGPIMPKPMGIAVIPSIIIARARTRRSEPTRPRIWYVSTSPPNY